VTESVRQIVGREHEIEVLFAAIDAAMSVGSAIAVCGEPGIGKSVLIENEGQQWFGARRSSGPGVQ
jgi:predicted ATP-dependent serine protease